MELRIEMYECVCFLRVPNVGWTEGGEKKRRWRNLNSVLGLKLRKMREREGEMEATGVGT